MEVRVLLPAPKLYDGKGERMIVDKAKEFALNAHKDQVHGCLTMADHLTAVTDKIKEQYTYDLIFPEFSLNEALAVGWLHDVIEDTNMTYFDIENNFGRFIAERVYAVTDGPGKTRTERHMNTYYRTRKYDISTFVKLADRWHNHQRTIENSEIKYAKVYASEYLYFKFALYRPSNYDSFWSQLDEQAKLLEEMVNGE